VIGLGVVALLWKNARALGDSIPLVSLTLLGFNSAVLSYGDSIRGYGLGMLTGLLAFGVIWRAADAPTPMHVTLALISSVVAVQCLYYNVVFVVSGCLAGTAVVVRRKSWRIAGLFLGIGTLAAISLLPYLKPIGQARKWNDLIRTDVSPAWIWFGLQEAFATTGVAIRWLWIGSAALALTAAVRISTASASRGISDRLRDAALYSAMAMSTGIAGYVLFLTVLGYYMQPWYFLALMALVAACLDLPLALLCRSVAPRLVRLVTLVTVVALVLHPIWTAARTRRTNIDLVASRLERLASDGDLIVLNPWYFGITFGRYYQGPAERTTVPPIADLSTHRYDLVKSKMMSSRAIDPVLVRIERTLQSGHRVFWVGDLFIPEGEDMPEDPPSAPHPRSGWSEGPYYGAWGLEAGYLIKTHAKAGERIEIPVHQPVSPYEDVAVYVFSGWWDPTAQ
jgi:hypothetical protein